MTPDCYFGQVSSRCINKVASESRSGGYVMIEGEDLVYILGKLNSWKDVMQNLFLERNGISYGV